MHRNLVPIWMTVTPAEPGGSAPAAPEAPATPAPAAPVAPAATAPPAAEPQPLHEDPAIAKALEGLTPEQRETLLTTGGRNALAARGQEVKDAKARAAKAADDARKDLAQTIGKALGLVEDEQIDPTRLAAQVSTEKAAAQQARVELAVFRAAADAQGDPSALLDSTSFLRSLEGIDPSDTAAVQAAITAAVAANPRLGVAPAAPAAPAPRVPAPNPAQGSSANGAPVVPQLTEAEVKRMYADKQYDAIEQARQEGRLTQYLGG